MSEFGCRFWVSIPKILLLPVNQFLRVLVAGRSPATFFLCGDVVFYRMVCLVVVRAVKGKAGIIQLKEGLAGSAVNLIIQE
jgi:hypothetical protein